MKHSEFVPPFHKITVENSAEAQMNKLINDAIARAQPNKPPLKKNYRPRYIWGQMLYWFKQTSNDPAASLSAERRGPLSLPDPESAFEMDRKW